MAIGPAEALQEALRRKVLPALSAHGGSVELISLEDGVAYLQLQGACVRCAAAAETLENLIMPALAGIPGIREIRLNEATDPEMLVIARQILRQGKG